MSLLLVCIIGQQVWAESTFNWLKQLLLLRVLFDCWRCSLHLLTLADMSIWEWRSGTALLHVFPLVFGLCGELKIQILIPWQVDLTRMFNLSGATQYFLQVRGLQFPMLLTYAHFRLPLPILLHLLVVQLNVSVLLLLGFCSLLFPSLQVLW